ncbi:MAG: hypothetical protein HQL31_13640, partial [Planctomycetes bacterium]|nr:hypothetical protein [Planctomycetota bacterium]
MPGMTGLEFVKKRKELVKDPLVYIITAEDNNVALRASEERAVPVKRYILKPWHISLFSVDLREDLRERELRIGFESMIQKHLTDQASISKELKSKDVRLQESLKQKAVLLTSSTMISGIKHELGNKTGCIKGLNSSLGFLLEDIEADTSASIPGKYL